MHLENMESQSSVRLVNISESKLRVVEEEWCCDEEQEPGEEGRQDLGSLAANHFIWKTSIHSESHSRKLMNWNVFKVYNTCQIEKKIKDGQF